MAYNLGPVKSWVAAAANALGPMFGIKTIGGWRKSDPYPDHPSGLALDFMTSSINQGNQLANYGKDNAAKYGIDYIIWNDRVWSTSRAKEGWRPYQPDNPNRNRHRDHVHMTFKKSAPSGNQATLNDHTDDMPVIVNYTDDDGLIGAVNKAASALGGMAKGVESIGALAQKLMWLALPTTQVRIISGILGIVFLFLGVRLLVKEAK